MFVKCNTDDQGILENNFHYPDVIVVSLLRRPVETVCEGLNLQTY